MVNLKSELYKTFVYEDDGVIEGYAVVMPHDWKSEEKTSSKEFYIHNFAVAENARRKGVGSDFFAELEEKAREMGCECIKVGADIFNDGAIAFYKKMGLSPVSISLEKRI